MADEEVPVAPVEACVQGEDVLGARESHLTAAYSGAMSKEETIYKVIAERKGEELAERESDLCWGELV